MFDDSYRLLGNIFGVLLVVYIIYILFVNKKPKEKTEDEFDPLYDEPKAKDTEEELEYQGA